MSTRALYTFKASQEYEHDWNVYKHHDGYPTGAAEHIAKALNFAWKLPRYESDEFAAAFIAANKVHWDYKKEWAVDKDYLPGGQYSGFSSGGGVRLMPQGDPIEVATKNCSDIEYRYVVYKKGDKLRVIAFRTSIPWRDNQTLEDKPIFECDLNTMEKHAKAYEKKQVTA
jgi:hypothetical protein